MGVLSVHVVTFTMETPLASSESTDSSPLSQFIEIDIQEIKKKLRKMNMYLGKIDSKGGRRLEKVDRDMAYLRKEFARSISHTENALTRMLVELEIKFEKLELKVVKMETENFLGSSSHYGEKSK